MGVIIRIADPRRFSVHQLLVRMRFLPESASGQVIANCCMDVLYNLYGIEPSKVVAFIHDSASCNGVASKMLQLVCSNLIDVPCISHTLDLAGDQMDTAVANDFHTNLLSLWSSSSKSKNR